MQRCGVSAGCRCCQRCLQSCRWHRRFVVGRSVVWSFVRVAAGMFVALLPAECVAGGASSLHGQSSLCTVTLLWDWMQCHFSGNNASAAGVQSLQVLQMVCGGQDSLAEAVLLLCCLLLVLLPCVQTVLFSRNVFCWQCFCTLRGATFVLLTCCVLDISCCHNSGSATGCAMLQRPAVKFSDSNMHPA